jgi:hypothetical protein
MAAFARHGATNLASADARAALAIAPTPAEAATLTRARIAAALRRGGRQRNIERLADTLHRASTCARSGPKSKWRQPSRSAAAMP